MKNTLFKSLLVLTAIILMASKCKRDTPLPPAGDYQGGFLILNEGQFMQENATVSFLKEDLNHLEDSIFYKVNGMKLGDIAQSMFTDGDDVYFVINNSDRIVVANRWTMEKLSIISSGIKSPRYMVKVSDDKAVVSNWGELFDDDFNPVPDDYLAWVDLNSKIVIDTMPIATGPEQMAYSHGKLYVAIQGIGMADNRVAVVDPADRRILRYIETGYYPTAVVKDDEGYVWVLCQGIPAWMGNEEGGKLVQINPETDEVITTVDLPADQHPQYMAYDNQFLYIIVNHVLHKVPVNDPAINASTAAVNLQDFALPVQTPYGISVADQYLFIGDAGDFTSPGRIYVFELNSLNLVTFANAGYAPKQAQANF